MMEAMSVSEARALAEKAPETFSVFCFSCQVWNPLPTMKELTGGFACPECEWISGEGAALSGIEINGAMLAEVKALRRGPKCRPLTREMILQRTCQIADHLKDGGRVQAVDASLLCEQLFQSFKREDDYFEEIEALSNQPRGRSGW